MRIKPDIDKSNKEEKIKIEPKVNCIRFEGCTAPICPLDESFTKAVWYPDEDICMVRTYRREHWRIIQRKIKKVNDTKNTVEGFFPLMLLENIHRVSSKVKGLTERQGVINIQVIKDFLANEGHQDDNAETIENDGDEENGD